MHDLQRAVVIARVSSKRQEDEGYSLPAQKKLLNQYAVDRGLTVLHSFEIAESASKSIQRKIFKDAMKFIEDNNVKHLIVEKVDRHVRNLQDAVETHDWLLADEDKKVHFVKDSLILHKGSRSQEWLNWGIRVVMAKNYIDNLREEAMKGWAEKLAQGWKPSSPPPGYKTIVQNGQRIHVIDPLTAPIMKQMFYQYLNPNETIASVTRSMNTLGIRTRMGRPYAKSHVQRILNNPFYVGVNRFDGKDYPGAQEQLIAKSVYERVQQKMTGKTPMVRKIHNPIFKNLVYCDGCGRVLTWQLQKGRYYGCCKRSSELCCERKFIREDLVEQVIVSALIDLVNPCPVIIDWFIADVKTQHAEADELRATSMASVEIQINRIKRMEDILYDDKLSGEISIERYKHKQASLEQQRTALECKLKQLTADKASHLEQRIFLLELTQKAAEIYTTRTPDQKRLLFSKLFSSITNTKEGVSVKYTKFAEIIAQKSLQTQQLLGGIK